MIVTHRPVGVLDSTADDRARLVARMAIRAFGDGVRSADWLVQPNDGLGGQSPLFIAKESMVGASRVCQMLEELLPRSTA